jgi:hypothetical protein
MEAKIQERLNVYRQSLDEWNRRAADAMAKAQACRGAIEALEDLLPPVPLEAVLKSVEDAGK